MLSWKNYSTGFLESLPLPKMIDWISGVETERLKNTWKHTRIASNYNLSLRTNGIAIVTWTSFLPLSIRHTHGTARKTKNSSYVHSGVWRQYLGSVVCVSWVTDFNGRQTFLDLSRRKQSNFERSRCELATAAAASAAARELAATKPGAKEVLIQSERIKSELQTNQNLVVTKPDKGRPTVTITW